jgi:Tetratricopeptide repeat-like domain
LGEGWLFDEDLSFGDDDAPGERLFDREPPVVDAENPLQFQAPDIPVGGEFGEGGPDSLREGSEREWAVDTVPAKPWEPESTPTYTPPSAESGGGSSEPPYAEEQPPARTATNGLPGYPGDNRLLPHEKVALRFITEGERELQQDNLDLAQDRFEAAVELAPLQPYGYYFLARVAFARGGHKQALAFLRKAEVLLARKDPAWLGETVSMEGAVYEDMGEYDRARAAYQRCLEAAPQNLRALSAVARLGDN